MGDLFGATNPLAWFWFALLSALFAALTAIFSKKGVEEIPSNMATWVRVIVIFVVASVFVVAQGEWVNPGTMSRKALQYLALSGVATGLSWLCYFKALKLGEASLVAPVDKLSVVLVMIFGTIFLGETKTPLQWAGGALIVAGVILVTRQG